MLFTLSLPFAARAGSGDYSLVMDGRIYDVRAISDGSNGRLLSADLLVKVAKADGRVSLAVRPDRGHIVLTSPVKGGPIATLQGFTTASITFVVNGNPVQARGRLVGGVPYLEAYVLQTVLEQLRFNVLVSHESFLITVSRGAVDPGVGLASDDGGEQDVSPGTTGKNASASKAGAGGTGGAHRAAGDPLPPSAGNLLEAVQQGSQASLLEMNKATGSTAGSAEVASAGGQGGSSPASVCGAMDTLRTLWEATEPSQDEKAAFRELADKFQKAKDSGGKIDPVDLQHMATNLGSFRKKVERRTAGTRFWSAPPPAQEVQRTGNDFLGSINQVLDLSDEMLKAMQRNDREYAKQIEKKIEELKKLERTVTDQGMRFNLEVVQVRQAYGCGPASTGMPPS